MEALTPFFVFGLVVAAFYVTATFRRDFIARQNQGREQLRRLAQTQARAARTPNGHAPPPPPTRRRASRPGVEVSRAGGE